MLELLLLLTAFVIFLICRNSKHYKDIVKKFLNSFWSYQEMRMMIAACATIYFASLVVSSSLEQSSSKPEKNLRINHHHDFGYSTINLKHSDPGYPIKLEVTEKRK